MQFKDGMLEHGNWLISFFEEYRQFFERCNWYTFHPIFFEIENDEILGGFEITIIVMGLGVRWRWNHTETKAMEDIKTQIQEIKNDPT